MFSDIKKLYFDNKINLSSAFINTEYGCYTRIVKTMLINYVCSPKIMAVLCLPMAKSATRNLSIRNTVMFGATEHRTLKTMVVNPPIKTAGRLPYLSINKRK